MPNPCFILLRESGEQPLSRAGIAAHGVAASTADEQRRWRVIALLADDAPLAEIVAATGYRPRTIRQIAQRYRESGPTTLEDRRAHGKGAMPLLTPALQHELWAALQQPPAEGGVWNGPAVARWISAKTGKHVHRQRGWEYLLRLAHAPLTLPDESG